jgi:hypothetical protein
MRTKQLILILLTGLLLLSGVVGFAKKTKKKRKTVTITRETMQQRQYKLIPLKSISFESVEMMTRPLLSKGALMTFEKNRNSILVYDYPENIKKIQEFLNAADREAVNIRIDIDYVGGGSGIRSGLGMKFNYGRGYRKPQIVIKDGKLKKPESIKINPYHRQTRTSRRDSTFIVTKSGYPASLWAGKTIVDPSWLNNLILNPTIIIPGRRGGAPMVIEGTDVDFKWSDVGAALEVLPTYSDNGLIHVEVYPRISYLDGKGKKQAVKVESMSTTLTVREGQKVNIGGLVKGRKNQFFNLFGPDFFKRNDFSNVLNMYLTATVISPAGQRKDGKRFKQIDKHLNRENPWKWR